MVLLSQVMLTPHITKAIQDQAAKGVLYGTPTELEIEFSKNYEKLFRHLKNTIRKLWN